MGPKGDNLDQGHPNQSQELLTQVLTDLAIIKAELASMKAGLTDLAIIKAIGENSRIRVRNKRAATNQPLLPLLPLQRERPREEVCGPQPGELPPGDLVPQLEVSQNLTEDRLNQLRHFYGEPFANYAEFFSFLKE
jgi:hypothetical protein